MAAWATLAAVIVALAIPTVTALARSWRSPRLHLTADTTNTQMELWIDPDADQESDAWFVRLAVSNAKGKRTARGVEVVVSSAERVDGDEVVRLPSPALGWTSSLEREPLRTIGPGMSRPVDLGWVVQPGSGSTVRFRVGIKGKGPNNMRHELPSGTWRIALDVVAHNASPKHYVVTTKIESDWRAGCASVSSVT